MVSITLLFESSRVDVCHRVVVHVTVGIPILSIHWISHIRISRQEAPNYIVLNPANHIVKPHLLTKRALERVSVLRDTSNRREIAARS